MKRIITLSLAVFLMASMLTACSSYKKLDTKIEGEISVMLWSGDGTFAEDIGHKDLAPEDLKGQNQAAAYAVAKAFNAIYPNVKINVYAKSGGPNDNGTSWAQELENFKAEHGRYPDVYASTDLVGDVAKGLVADLSQFKDDPLYKSFNKSVMGMMNYYGFQAGIPQFLQPWGVYVNKALAEENNIDVPGVNWTIEEYTDFINEADNENFWGAMDTEMNFIRTGSTSFEQMMFNYKGTGDYVDLDSDEIKALLDFVPEWSKSAIWTQRDLGLVSDEVMNANWWWSHKFFMENKILTNGGDPWMMGDCANPDPSHWAACKSTDWDIYPRPSTDYQPNTVGVVLDPMAVTNYCMIDGNAECTAEEKEQVKLAYTFASFWAGDTRSWQARADQEFLDGEILKTAMNDSLPLVTGDEFDEQMEIWYSAPNHTRFKDAAVMPGFHEVLKIWEAGQFWAVSDKAYPWTYDFEGASRPIIYEWDNIWNPEVAGARRTDANWADSVKSKLSDWNTAINQRFEDASASLKNGLKTFYGFEDSDFK
ncbi:MAG TPA: hypothetical protein DCQ90_05365 [Erysipelotrichaceae bacterium]|nr:hypothetical protein [Erysipelotrichaceae bacterium]